MIEDTVQKMYKLTPILFIILIKRDALLWIFILFQNL
jgi:hypothetical protein